MTITIPYGKPRHRGTSTITVRFPKQPGLPPIMLSGRMAWALLQLYRAGARGCTPIDNPGPRWSDYVFKLRALGIDIETIREGHSGRFPGNHGRYVLRSHLVITEVSGDAEAA